MHSRLGVYGDLISVNIREDVFRPLQETFREVVKERNIECCGVLRYDGCKYSLTIEIQERRDLFSVDVPLDVHRSDLRTNLRLTLIEVLDAS
jgi:hypothetical protein